MPISGSGAGNDSLANYIASELSRRIKAGTIADIQVGTLKLIDGQSVILGRDLGGLYAMTRVCTHQGALVGLVSVAGVPALHCSAHGSEFSMYGAVTPTFGIVASTRRS